MITEYPAAALVNTINSLVEASLIAHFGAYNLMSAYNVQWATRFGGATRSQIVGCNATPGTEGNFTLFLKHQNRDPRQLQIQRKGDQLTTTRGPGAWLSKVNDALILRRGYGATVQIATDATVDELAADFSHEDHLGFVMTQVQIQLACT